MKEKQLRQLILGAIGVVIVVLIVLIINNVRGKQQATYRDTISFKFDSTNYLELSNSGTDLKFELKDGKWTVNSLDSDSSRIQAIVDNIFDSKVTAIISQNDSNYPLFNLDDTNAKHLIIKSNAGGNTDIYLGKASVTAGMYVRFANDKNVYEINKDLSNYLATDINFYRSKTILNVNPGTIQSFKIGGTLFTKDNTDWVSNGNKLNLQKVNDYINIFGALNAVNIATPDQTTNTQFNDSDLKLQITTDKPVDIELTTSNNNYFAKKEGLVYIVSKDDFDKLNKKIEDFN